MINFLSSLDSILVNVLVVIGVFIIVSGAIKTLWEFIRYETEKKKQKDTIEEFRQFSLIRSHLTISIILALPLFIIKFLDDAVKAQSQTAYLYPLALVVILAIMIFSYKKPKLYIAKEFKYIFLLTLISSIIFSSIFAGIIGFWAGSLSSSDIGGLSDVLGNKKVVKINEQSDIISAVKKVSPAVVNIIITKDLPKIERYYSNPSPNDDFFNHFFGNDFFNFQIPQYKQNGTEKKEIGGGTGFIISKSGYVVTNKHVVNDEEAEYTVLMNDENKYEAKVTARDPATDLAVLKIKGDNFPIVELGDSSSLEVGQTVIAIGNALGEFRNTVSAGVISGLSRSITAGEIGFGKEQLNGVIQTDASINPGNSGGPLLNITGQVIGINTAIVQGAQNIGFAIPINEVKNSIESVKEHGKIVRPWLGVRYVVINKSIAESNKLDVDYGALIIRGEERTDLAVIPGSPADKAGLVENDIILEVNGKKINQDYPLINAIGHFKAGDEITLKILHKGDEKEVAVKLEEVE